MNRQALKLKEECGLCHRADSDPDTYGQKCQRGKLCVHENCLYHASGLVQRGKDEEGFYGFLYPDIRQELKRAVQKTCCVCGCKGASVACQGRKCTKNFHFPCGSERGCIYQFFGEFKSFCWKHRPVQRVRRRQQQAETICIICLESMPGKPSYSAMVCPACKHAWFHRGCIQVRILFPRWFLGGHALRAALYHFRCPRCRDMGTFQREMFRMGIKIPDRDAAWEEDGAFSDQYHRHSRCDAGCCLYVGGREQSAEAGPWELLLCHSCGSQGTHRRCSSLGATRGPWECEDCAEPAGAASGHQCWEELWTPGVSLPLLISAAHLHNIPALPEQGAATQNTESGYKLLFCRKTSSPGISWRWSVVDLCSP
ncbi:PHD finger protein 7-like [Malaclemys terrapin pileata]|uniref:PHD finger protein 7-like n=1 Tax=Malaclemys terrapin pileata TaxID=2991368 RepID=UPI0023A80DFB|nr:PHD finger protein 7-like [Malaclemys terrapin pileata]